MISIIIPAYGPQLFLTKCISSIYNSINGQDLNFEIIVVVDRNNLDSHKKKLINFNKVKYLITKSKPTPASVRNLGATEAKKEWLFFLDSDCELNGNYFRRLIKYLKEYSNYNCFQGEIIASEHEAIPLDEDYDYRKSLYKYLYNEDNLICSKILSGANFIIRKNVFQHIGGFEEKLAGAEDRELGARLFQSGEKIIYKPDLVVYHHYYPDLWSTMKRHIWHAKWNSKLYVHYPHIFARPFMTRFNYSLSYLKKLWFDFSYFFCVVVVYNLVFIKEYLTNKLKNGKK